MSIPIKSGDSSDLLSINSNKEMKVALTTNVSSSGYAAVAAVIDEGNVTGNRLARGAYISPNRYLSIGVDQMLWQDVFNHGQVNTSKYKITTSTMTNAFSNTRFVLNSGNAVASGNSSQMQTYRTFTVYGKNGLLVDMWNLIPVLPQTNNIVEFGLGIATGTSLPTDGVFFRATNGQFYGVVNRGGVETTVLLQDYTANLVHHYRIVVTQDRAEFWRDDGVSPELELLGSIDIAILTASSSLPLLFRIYNNAAVSQAVRLEIAQIAVTQTDLNMGRDFGSVMVGNGASAISQPDGATAGQTANYANSAAPGSSTLSNTTCTNAATVLHGQWQFAAPAGAETDYILFGFLNPAGTAAIPGRNMWVKGVKISTFVMGAASATTPTLLQWGLGIGGTALSLATSDSSTAASRAFRRIVLGSQSIPVGSAIGSSPAPEIFVTFEAPLLVEPGTYLNTIVKIPVGTATASEIIRGIVFINAFWE